jgi:hypothetical protein
LVAFALVLRATDPPGPGLDPDALSYVGAATTLADHGGYRVPSSGWGTSDTTEALAHFPPGFSTAIAVPVALGLPPIQSGRLVVALSAFASAAILYLLLAWVASPLTALLGTAAAIVTPALVSVHLSVLSEPLFIVAMLLAVAAMTAQPPPDARWSGAAALRVGLAVAAAALVRYVGIAFVVAAVVWMLAQHGPWRRRLRDAGLAALPATLLLGAWIVRSTRLAGKESIRKFGRYRDVMHTVHEGLDTIMRWLAPDVLAAPWRLMAVAAVLLTIVVIAPAGLRKISDWYPRATRMMAAAAILATTYAGFLVASRLFADPNIPFDDRILAPLFLLVEIALAVAAWQWAGTRDRWARGAAAIVFGVWLAGSFVVSRGMINDAMTDGADFAATSWRYSPTIAWVRANAARRPLYTNWPAALYFHVGRGSHILPAGLDPLTLRRFRARVARTDGIIVGFDVPTIECASPDSIASRLRLQPLARLADGTIWALPPTTAAATQ